MSCRGASCQQGRRDCTDYICNLSSEAFEKEMNWRRAHHFIYSIAAFFVVLCLAKVIV